MAASDMKDDAKETTTVTKSDAATSERYTRSFLSTTQPEPTFKRMITIKIGPQAEEFSAHAHLLKADSDYFRTALEGEWEEAKKGVFVLVEENPAVFAMYLEWLYHDRIAYKDTDDADILLVELYLLGRRRGSSKFCNATISKINGLLSPPREVGLEAINLAFTETIEKSKLRALIVDKLAWDMHPSTLTALLKNTDDTPPDLALGVCQALLQRMLLSSEDSTVGRCTSSTTNHTWTCKQQPSCSTCGQAVAMQHAGSYMSGPTEAPYKKDFCANYHVHVKGEKCA